MSTGEKAAFEVVAEAQRLYGMQGSDNTKVLELIKQALAMNFSQPLVLHIFRGNVHYDTGKDLLRGLPEDASEEEFAEVKLEFTRALGEFQFVRDKVGTKEFAKERSLNEYSVYLNCGLALAALGRFEDATVDFLKSFKIILGEELRTFTMPGKTSTEDLMRYDLPGKDEIRLMMELAFQAGLGNGCSFAELERKDTRQHSDTPSQVLSFPSPITLISLPHYPHFPPPLLSLSSSLSFPSITLISLLHYSHFPPPLLSGQKVFFADCRLHCPAREPYEQFARHHP